MTSTDDILNQIDAALGDTSVSVDAMRCGPEPEGPRADDEVRTLLAAQVDPTVRRLIEATSTAVVSGRVWIAPVGTDPDDDTGWELLGYTTSVEIHDETIDDTGGVPPVPVVPFGQGREAARRILIARLVDRHGLNSFEAGDAVDEAVAGLDGPHTHLARAEAEAVIDEAMEPLREAMCSAVAAMRPGMENAARAMRRLAAAARAAAASSPADFALAPPQPPRPDDRPAWRSPYGPAARRRP